MNDMILMQIKLKDGWAGLWGAVEKAMGTQFTTLLSIIGVALVVFALGKWLWDKRKGGGGNSSALIWTAIVGAALAGPQIVFPILLTFVDWIINAIINVMPK